MTAPSGRVTSFSLYKRPGSRYWWITWVIRDGNGSHHILRSGRPFGILMDRHSRDEAMNIVRELSETQSPALNLDGNYTLSWMRSDIPGRIRREGRSEGTIRLYQSSLDRLIEHLGGDFPIADVRRAHVSGFQGYLSSREIAPATINKILRHVRGAFERYEDDELISKNPFRKFRQVSDRERSPKHLTEEQLRKFLEVIEAWKPVHYCRSRSYYEGLKRLVRIYIATGLRRREVLEIERDEIDLKNRRVRVQNIKGRRKEKRWITIPRAVHEDFKWYVMTFEGETPLNICQPDSLSHWIKARMVDAGLDDMHLHSLRHTFVTMALAAGENAWRIKDHLAHSDLRVTEGYAHTDVDDGREIELGTDVLMNGEQTVLENED